MRITRNQKNYFIVHNRIVLFIKIIHSPVGDLYLKQHSALEGKAVSVIT